MADWWDNVDLFFEFAPGDAPLTAVGSCTWVDISARVRSFRCRRGRNNELSSTSPGTATIVLNNRDSELDPAYTSGTWFGELLPMKRFRVRATIGATSATLFTGYVLGYPQSYPGLKDAIVQVQCVDGFRVLEQCRQPASAYEYEVLADSPSAYWRLDALDAEFSATAIAGGVDLIAYSGVGAGSDFVDSASTTLPIGQDTAVTNYPGVGLAVPTATPKAIEGWFTGWNGLTAGPLSLRASTDATNHIRVATVSNDDIYVGYSNSTDNRSLTTTNTGLQLPATTTHVALTATTTTLTLYFNGAAVWSSALSVGTASVSFTFTGTLVDSEGMNTGQSIVGPAVFAAAPSAARIQEHYLAGLTGYGHPYGDRAGARIDRILDSIGWASADRDLSQGETVLDTWLPNEASALSGCREVETTEQGLFFMSADGKATIRDRQWQMTNTRAVNVQATIGDDTGEIRYSDIDVDSNEATFIRNRVAVSFRSGSVAVKDATSIAAYTEQADSVNASNLGSGWLARQLAAFRLRLRKDPETRIPRVTVNVRGGGGVAVNLPDLIELDIGDRVRVYRRPRAAVDPINVVGQLQGIEHRIEKGGNWEIELYLAPAPPSYTEGPYLTVGDATYGDIGVAAGNLVPY